MTTLFLLHLLCTPEPHQSFTRFICERDGLTCSVWVDENGKIESTDCPDGDEGVEE